MIMKLRTTTFLILAFMLLAATAVTAQEDSTLTPTEEQQQKEKAEKEKKAFALLEQVVGEAQMLRLPENRARIQIGAASLLWQRDQGRARSLFTLAADNVAEMSRQASTNPGPDERRGPNQGRTAFQLRQELVLTAARYDATLAYQLLAATKPATVLTDRNAGGFGSEDNLEQRLLAEIAALDPKMALQNAEQMLEKGQYPRSLTEVLAQLRAKDKEAATRLEDKMVKRLQSANMLSTMDAGNLALSLLRPGPLVEVNQPNGAAGPTNNSGQLLGPSFYSGLLGSVIDAALRATIPPAGNRNQNRVRGQSSGPIVRGGDGRQVSVVNEPSTAELEQNNARRLLGGLQMLLPQIDQYLPSRAQAVRQKLTDMGFGNNSRGGGQPIFRAAPQSTSETLMGMATQVPPPVQSRIYQQAAMRALEEGNPERARQIANDHLEAAARNSVLQAVEFRQTSEKLDAARIDEVRQTLSGLRTDDERVDLLLRLSASVTANNPKLAVQLLEEALLYTNRRAGNYQQFEQQLRVASAFKDLAPSRSFEVLEPVVLQLNELLSAAATLSGFELNVFKDGELPLEARNGLSNMVTRYGAVLGQLAKSDFDRSQILANRFNLTEPRLIARLAIVHGMLGLDSGGLRNPVRFGPNTFIRLPPQ
jgi:hypothetical protein